MLHSNVRPDNIELYQRPALPLLKIIPINFTYVDILCALIVLAFDLFCCISIIILQTLPSSMDVSRIFGRPCRVMQTTSRFACLVSLCKSERVWRDLFPVEV